MNNANCSSKSSTPVNEAPTPKSVIQSNAEGTDCNGQLAIQDGKAEVAMVEDGMHDQVEAEVDPLIRNSVVRTSSTGPSGTGPSGEDGMTPGSHHDPHQEPTTPGAPRTILPKSALNTDLYGTGEVLGATTVTAPVEDLHRDVSETSASKERKSSLNQPFSNPMISNDRDSRQGEDTDDINLEVSLV